MNCILFSFEMDDTVAIYFVKEKNIKNKGSCEEKYKCIHLKIIMAKDDKI